MNDIFEIAKTYGEADYYDMCTGRTYLIAEWARAKRFGLPTIGIRIMEPDGSISSYIPDPDNKVVENDKPKKSTIGCSINKALDIYGDNIIGKTFRTVDGLKVTVENVIIESKKIDNTKYTTKPINVTVSFSNIDSVTDKSVIDAIGDGSSKTFSIPVLNDIIGTAHGILL